MLLQQPLKAGSLKDPNIAALFCLKDPEQRFNDLREIGHGSFGAVYFAFDSETNENVAIKKMSFSGKQAADRWADIIKEVKFLKNIKHPNIVEYKACYLKEQTCWLVMEYCIGSASDIVEVHKTPIFESEIAAICQQALAGLAYIHEISRIHRDIKAGNILLTDNGTVKLADLGSIASASPAQSFVGTPYWMAPEVILAMDEGHYDQRADIWSFGITCIELAERKPPFFNMNTMSALYHIAQNDPPRLKNKLNNDNTPLWSEKFVSFVDQCLRKEPEHRLSTNACLNHPFISEFYPPTVILELIRRTKRVVRELDNFQYKKMRKLMYLDEQQSNQLNIAGGIDAISLDSHEEIGEDESLSVHSDANHGETCSSMSETSGQSSRLSNKKPMQPFTTVINEEQKENDLDINSTPTTVNDNKTVINVGENVTQQGSVGDSSTDPTISSERSNSPNSFCISPLYGNISKEEAINTLRRNKFSTLRTTKLISREVEAHRTENNIYEQMSGYKRLRQTHHKEVQQLDEKLKIESDQLKVKLEKEYDNAIIQCEKELTKLRQQQQAELEKRHRQNEEEFRKFSKTKKNNNDHELKSFINIQKKEYRHNKEQRKANLKQQNLNKSQYESLLKAAKNDFALQKSIVEDKFREELNARYKEEILNLQKQQMLNFHELENKLLKEELNTRAKQIEYIHSILRRHHLLTQQQEQSQLDEVEKLKRRHMTIQHELELNNQNDYTRRTLDDLKKTHALQSKQQPRELKNKEALIRKQFRHACKIQTRQYKAYQAQLIQTVPKDEQKEMINKLKAEQTRKIADLAEKYEQTIKQMMSEQTIQLETWQEDELKQVSAKLTNELNELRAYQAKQREFFENQCQRDRKAFQDKLNHRQTMLERRMEDEISEFENKKEEQLRVMKERHTKEMAIFDNSYSPSSTNSNSTISNSFTSFRSKGMPI